MIVETPSPSWTVYAHIAPNGKMYVGITKHTLKERWRDGNGYKHNVYFQRAIQKYGWDAFQHVVVASGLTNQEAGHMERFLIEQFRLTDKEFGFNQTTGGEGAIDGHMFSPEVIERMRQSQKGKRKGSTNGNAKRVLCVDTGVEYASAKDAAI